jgi:tartrate/fumarate subfamily iron-sulfur-dependent hydro-lyase beta chain
MKKVLTTPLRDEDLADLKIGDVVYLTGRLVTCRDVAHRRLIEQGRQLPVNLEGGAIFHVGPIVRKKDDGGFEMVSIGPTTSMRMEKFEREFIKQTGVKLIVGKGGMALRLSQAVRNTKQFMRFSLEDVRYWQPLKSRKLKVLNGKTSGCLKPCGLTASRYLAR